MEELNFENIRHISDIDFKEDKYIFSNGKKLLNLSSNDYLGLSTNKKLIEKFLKKYSMHKDFLFSSASARLLSGNSKSYFELEKLLSILFKKEACLLFNTGYQCNLGIVSSIVKKGDVVFSDKLNHASIVAGLKLSGADFYRYKHLDYEHLESFLKKQRDNYKRALIISESIFSMDGDIADIKKLEELKQRYNTLLMIDEAHAFGVFGENLTGLSNGFDVDITVATFGKALGSVGAFCVAKKEIIDFLINKASSFIFSTALAPINILWTKFLLEENFNLLKEKSKKLQKLFKSLNLNSQIMPILIGESEKTVNISEKLKSMGYFVLPIRPPTVLKGTSRLRISLTSDTEKEEIETMLKIVEELK